MGENDLEATWQLVGETADMFNYCGAPSTFRVIAILPVQISQETEGCNTNLGIESLIGYGDSMVQYDWTRTAFVSGLNCIQQIRV